MFLFGWCGILLHLEGVACTLVLVSGNATVDGRPLLLKNRDSSEAPLVEMRVVKDEGFSYLAQFAVADSVLRGPWVGFNEKGFAIANSLSFNVKEGQGVSGNGELMRKGLATCETVDDFEQVLKEMDRPMDVMANFAVMDAFGGAAIFEVGKTDYVKYDVNDPMAAPGGMMVRSNYCLSGSETGRVGEDRYVIASRFLQELPVGGVSWKDLLMKLTRLLVNEEGTDLGSSLPLSYDDETKTDFDGFIPRDISTNAMVIQGVKEGESPLLTFGWAMVGPPMMTVVLPFFMSEELPQKTVSEGEGAWLSRKGLELKGMVFSYPDAYRVIDLSKLCNQEETGILQRIMRMEEEIVHRGETLMEETREAGVVQPSSLHAFHEWLDPYLDDEYAYAFRGNDGGDDGIVSEEKRGDLNHDGQVDVTDVTILVETVLKGIGTTAEADINGDGRASIADVSVVVDMVLGRNMYE